MIDDKFIKEVIFLGVGKIDDYYEMYAALMPFINELANLFTIDGQQIQVGGRKQRKSKRSRKVKSRKLKRKNN